MIENEFSELTRHELLELVLTQAREQKQLEERMAKMTDQMHELRRDREYLEQILNMKDRQIIEMEGYLDESDEQIETLKECLDEKNRQIEKLKACLDEKNM